MPSSFTVIKGGKKSPLPARAYRFLGGFATDTRLMGVVGMYLSWEEESADQTRALHQIFYLDCEARTVDSYSECTGPKNKEFEAEELRMTAALGAAPVELTEQEARFLLQAHVRSLRHAPPTAREPGRSGYQFMLTPTVHLSGSEYRILMRKICGSLPTTHFIINYYLMRAAALDTAGMAYLSEGGGFSDADRIYPGSQPDRLVQSPFPIKAPVTLCENRIEEAPDGITCYCHSLTERSDSYYITSTELELTPDQKAVARASLTSEFRITDVEAAMMLRRPELVTVFSFPEDSDALRSRMRDFTILLTDNIYRNGHLYVHFYETNRHVGRTRYRLNDDVQEVYYFSDQGQLLLMCYDHITAYTAEHFLTAAFQDLGIRVNVRFEFPDPVLYEFVNSDFDDFMEFLDYFCEVDD